MGDIFKESYREAWLRHHLYRWRKPRKRNVFYFRRYIRQAPPGRVAIDCGANVGDVTTLLLAHGFVVHAFEPGQHAVNVLQSRFGDNPNLTIYRQAVGARSRHAVLFRDESDSLQHSERSSLFRTSELGPLAVEQPTEVIDLFAFMNSLGQPIDVLKLDVEGAEFEMIGRLFDEGWYRRIGMIVIETHERLFPEFTPLVQEARNRLRREHIRNLRLDWV